MKPLLNFRTASEFEVIFLCLASHEMSGVPHNILGPSASRKMSWNGLAGWKVENRWELIQFAEFRKLSLANAMLFYTARQLLQAP